MKAMKKLSERFQLKKFWQDESAQGMTEYILLVVVVVSLAYMFKDKIKTALRGKVEGVSNEIDQFSVDKG